MTSIKLIISNAQALKYAILIIRDIYNEFQHSTCVDKKLFR